ncbi:WXG100 family type VII secretion target [Amycolatopsis sp. NPDC051903]|uniref:WXG100 family type VII secretion target n=1 Tax=Amycolatopsis sp. NPDC051903 TaxID=3363936 RepID=UPI0037B0A170
MTEPSLTFVSELARELGVTDPVAVYYRPLVGRWEDLDEEAQRLRTAAKTAGGVSAELAEELGRLDASWSGADADAFVTYLGEIRSASEGVEDALDELAGALDELAGTLRKIVGDATHVLTDAADLLSESAMLPVGGVSRSRAQLRETEQSMRSFYDAAEDVLQEFGRLCDGVDAPAGEQSSITVRRHYPAEQFRLHGSDSARPAAVGAAAGPEQAGSRPADSAASEAEAQPGTSPDQVENSAPDTAAADPSGTTAPSSADDSVSPSAAGEVNQGKESGVDPRSQQVDAGVLPVQPEPAPAPAQPAQGQPGMAMPMMPMMGGFGGGAGGGGGGTRQPKNRTSAKSSDLLGEPEHVVPPVIGEDPRPQKPDKAKKPQK